MGRSSRVIGEISLKNNYWFKRLGGFLLGCKLQQCLALSCEVVVYV